MDIFVEIKYKKVVSKLLVSKDFVWLLNIFFN